MFCCISCLLIRNDQEAFFYFKFYGIIFLLLLLINKSDQTDLSLLSFTLKSIPCPPIRYFQSVSLLSSIPSVRRQESLFAQ
ncbi:hypothetical protein H206_05464 [Candidatus Electrothrix aarhusensis]|uniref:Uncharacterized protein n=1 Tax=Candidatus Electrothrix aarhusensis TaxID=1859131 RepID=A0A444J4G5_9BACT|nr:hypothetical protein H206_05464 [Candidatus Electrothrix aarhusensis]